MILYTVSHLPSSYLIWFACSSTIHINFVVPILYLESEAQPKYVDVFSNQTQWEGTYMYNGTSYYCMLFIHSEHYLKKDGLLVTFKDKQGATIEMEGRTV